MRQLWAVMWVALAAHAEGPDRDVFLFELSGVPVGTVELSWEPVRRHYRYQSTHWFNRNSERERKERTAEFAVDEQGRVDGAALVSLWLWNRPSRLGCVPGREELGARVGPLCLEATEGEEARGTVFGEAFEAHYAGDRLRRLSLGSARFTVSSDHEVALHPPDLFAHGISAPAGAGQLLIEPAALRSEVPLEGKAWSLAEARALAESVHRGLVDENKHGCLDHARRFVEQARSQGRAVAMVYGLWYDSEAKQAFPHAWVRVSLGRSRTVDLDPTLLQAVHRDRYLPLAPADGASEFGRRVLALYAGTAHLARR